MKKRGKINQCELIIEAVEQLSKNTKKTKITLEKGENSERLNQAINNLKQKIKTSEEKIKKEVEHQTSTFLNISSHELRTPLTPMSAQLQMLLSGYFGKLSEKQEKSIEIILRNTKKLDKLIKDVLDISRLRAESMQVTFKKGKLNELIKTIINEKKTYAKEKKVRIIINLNKKIPDIVFDQGKLGQVITDVLDNAIKFTPEKGKVTISSTKKGTKQIITIQDTGIGIEKKDYQLIFEPFKQVNSEKNRNFEGTGLGLAIAKGIMKIHKGEIKIISTIDKGTTVQIILPNKLKETQQIDPLAR